MAGPGSIPSSNGIFNILVTFLTIFRVLNIVHLQPQIKNLYPILYLMEEQLKDGSANLHSVRKIATLSAFEVFCDILPEYQIRHQDYSNVKCELT